MFVNSVVCHMEKRASTMWVIPLFGQAVNKKALYLVDACGGGLGGCFNPAGSLMIPLCLK